MKFLLDTNIIRFLFKFYSIDNFPIIWDSFNTLVNNQRILSVKEVYKELEKQLTKENRTSIWVFDNKHIFETPTEEEINNIKKIFSQRNFQNNISKTNLLEGNPVADAFIVAKAKALEATVVTDESVTPTAAKIPNMCEFLKVNYINLDGFIKILLEYDLNNDRVSQKQ